MNVREELLRPPDQAPLTVEPIYRDFPTLIGGPRHGEQVPIWALNRNDLVLPMTTEVVAYYDEAKTPPAPAFEQALYTKGKFASAGSRRVLYVWYFVELTEDERGALTWHAILERANLT